ncbi:MAG TPA: DUF4080 domain-containing protein [Desulfopila sp.]|nr:DUF4080 domain-containing protein [Desulfopila sp.]
MRITLVGLNARYTHSCLALFYVRNELLQRNALWDVRIQQFTINDSYYELLLQLTVSASDYYFFSASIWNDELVTKLVTDLLAVMPSSRCVVGGPQAEVVGERYTGSRMATVTGDIESVEPQFYQDLMARQLKPVYVGCGGLKDFSSPYHSSDYTLHLQNRQIYYETSRGCPFSCSYCLSAAGKGVFHKSLDMVRRELGDILEWNPAVVRFVDRTFNDDQGRAVAIWDFLVDSDVDTVFHFEMSPDRISEEMFAFLHDLPVGKFQFEMGIQSTHAPTLAAIRRPVDLKAEAENIRRLRALGNIHLHVDLILGLPFETESSFIGSFRHVFAMEPHYIQMGLLKILPNTPICAAAADFGYNYSSTAPYPVLANSWLDHSDMSRLYWFGECVERFVNNRYFVSLWDYLRGQGGDIGEFFQGLLQICMQQDFFQRAPTQEYLCRLMSEWTQARTDAAFIQEILRYDWLRCGHRYLPAFLDVGQEKSSKTLRSLVFNCEKKGLVKDTCRGERAYCMKKGFFCEFSCEFLSFRGYPVAGDRNFLCFVPAREEGLFRFVKTELFSLEKSGKA